MRSSNPVKCVVLSPKDGCRDDLKPLLANQHMIPFYFRSESSCLDNLPHLVPAVVVVQGLSVEKLFRFVNATKMSHAPIPVLIITGDCGIKTLVGINDYPSVACLDHYRPEQSFMRVVSDLAAEAEKPVGIKEPLLVGHSAAIIHLKEAIPELRRHSEPILIQGESGTGKKLLGRYIFRKGPATTAMILTPDRFALPAHRGLDLETIVGDDLAGRSFDGRHDGNQKIALIFEEVGRLPANIQADIFKVTDNRSVRLRQNGHCHTVEVRVVTSTSQNLEKLTETGRFRKDLLYRLNAFTLHLPPLRKRRDDISMLTDFFTDRYCSAFQKSHFRTASSVRNTFTEYHWPGNVRQLRETVYAYVKNGVPLPSGCESEATKRRCLPPVDTDDLIDLPALRDRMHTVRDLSLKTVSREFVEIAEKKVIITALDRVEGNRKKAAAMMGISYRSLLSKTKAYRIQ